MTDEFDFDYAEGWKPQPGDVLIGVVTETSVRQGQYDPYPVITVRQDNGESRAFHAFHTVAQNQIVELNVQTGDRVGIKYMGKLQTRDGRGSYEGYRIKKSGGASPGIDWAKAGVAGEQPGDPVPSTPDVPFDTAGLPEPLAAPAAPAGSQFGSEVPF